MSLLRLNSSCVAIGGRAVLIEGEPGSGKSTLALGLVDRGAGLVGDDGVTLGVRLGHLWASPPPRCRGKLEIRNVGIVHVPACDAPLALAVLLDPHAPRHAEALETVGIEQFSIPLIRLYPDCPALPLRVEWALKTHGIQ